MTRVALTIDYTMGGTLAQFSREGIVRDLAQRLTDTFAMNLRHKLEAVDGAAATDSAALPPEEIATTAFATADSATERKPIVAAAVDRSPAPPAALNFGALLWAALKDRLRRSFHRRPRG